MLDSNSDGAPSNALVNYLYVEDSSRVPAISWSAHNHNNAVESYSALKFHGMLFAMACYCLRYPPQAFRAAAAYRSRCLCASHGWSSELRTSKLQRQRANGCVETGRSLERSRSSRFTQSTHRFGVAWPRRTTARANSLKTTSRIPYWILTGERRSKS